MKIRLLICFLWISLFFEFCLHAENTKEVVTLLNEKSFSESKKNLSLESWDIFCCGEINRANGNGSNIPELKTERFFDPVTDKETWEGILAYKKLFEMYQGQTYKLTVEARGSGNLTFGFFEYPWKYSAEILKKPAKQVPLSEQWKSYEFDYHPMEGLSSHIRPFINISGWLKRAQIKKVTLELVKGHEKIQINATKCIVTPGSTVDVQIKSDSFPVKLLVYGNSGQSGPGGEMSGSGAFTDILRKSITLSKDDLNDGKYTLKLSEDFIEGSSRIVAVNVKSGVISQTTLCVYRKEYADKFLKLLEDINLPHGTRIIFVGDSLTANFPGRNYCSIIERMFKWKFGKDVEVFNAGIGGDNILRIQKRLENDVINKKPTHVFLFEGANDTKRTYDPKTGNLGRWAVPEDQYNDTYQQIVKDLKQKTNAKIIIATTAPGNLEIQNDFFKQKKIFDIKGNIFGIPEETAKAIDIQKNIAEKEGLDIIDTNTLLANYMKKRNDSGSNQYLHVDDGVHLSEYGSREVAIIFLEYLKNYNRQD